MLRRTTTDDSARRYPRAEPTAIAEVWMNDPMVDGGVDVFSRSQAFHLQADVFVA